MTFFVIRLHVTAYVLITPENKITHFHFADCIFIHKLSQTRISIFQFNFLIKLIQFIEIEWYIIQTEIDSRNGGATNNTNFIFMEFPRTVATLFSLLL